MLLRQSNNALLILALVIGWPAAQAAAGAAESDYYRIIPLPIPEGLVIEPGALEMLPDGRLAVGTRRGEIYLVSGAWADPPKDLKFSRFAFGLHEILGLAYRDGWLYATQRPELSRLKDTDGDGRADVFETVNDDWDISGNYHEYAFGSKFDPHGDLWVALCLTGSSSSQAKFRGWCVRITPAGKLVPTASGLRSPGGIGLNAAGDMFYTDNQGPWNGVCTLRHLAPGSFQGNPEGNRWYDQAPSMGRRPPDPESESRIMIEAAKIPELMPPAIMFPYPKMGQSASGIACDTSGGKFGPFKRQMFVADQSHSTLMRVDLEQVNGRYQGACFPFREGFASGNLAMLQAPDGSLVVGGTNRGWGSRGVQPYSLERLVWTGRRPMEVLSMRARHDGFELEFTEPIDPATGGNVASYSMSTYTYIYHKTYGSPEVDATRPKIKAATVSEDARRVRLVIDKLQAGHVHELHLDGVRSQAGEPLLHREAYYTLNYIPAAEKR
jgi:glucose/arabinose dehydrogenase